MESAPRLPMLSCELKSSPSNAEFGPALKKYIAEHYLEDPDSYSNEIRELEALRMAAIKVSRDFTGCSVLKRYYSQLLCLQSRFPMTDEGAACVPFMWTDIYSGMVFNIMDIKYEQASILYNIGALHSKLGALENRSSSEGMKIACTHFQCAAWALSQVKDLFPQPKGSDMSHDLLLFFVNIFLGQAQECILEKSMLDRRKSSITAKVAAQVVEYFRAAVSLLLAGSASSDSGSIQEIVGTKLMKLWKKILDFKMAYYSSVSCLHMGNQAEEAQKMGERQAWYQLAVQHLNEATSIAKGLEEENLGETLSFAMDVIGGKFKAAKKENEFVYHERVPPMESLPEVKGANLVKGISFSPTDPEISGPDIFARLVPMEAHEASSIYSEEKARLLRSVTSHVERKNEELQAFLSSLNLDKSMLVMDPQAVPQEVVQCCARLSVCPTAVSDLVLTIQGLKELYHNVDKDLAQVEQLLKEEREKEAAHSTAFGKRAPSNLVTELTAEFTKYLEVHQRTADSNSALQKSLAAHSANLKLLASPLEEVDKALPSVSLLDVPNNEAVVKELSHLLDKVEEMKKQRQMLHSHLRDALQKDDITRQIVTRNKGEDLQAFFATELKKHDQEVSLLEQNLTAQDNILKALTQANARFAETRKAASDILKRREAMVASLIASFEAYEDLVAKTQKGVEFYKKMQTNVGKLLARLRSVIKVQDEERALQLEAQARKAGKLGGLPSSSSGSMKLKDFLPYMTGQGMPLPAETTGTSAYYSTTSYAGYQTPHVIPQVSSDKGTSETSDKAADVVGMGVRPTPLGSEQPSPQLSVQSDGYMPGSYSTAPFSENYSSSDKYSKPVLSQMPANSSLQPGISNNPSMAYHAGYTEAASSVASGMNAAIPGRTCAGVPRERTAMGPMLEYHGFTEYTPSGMYNLPTSPASTLTYTFRNNNHPSQGPENYRPPESSTFLASTNNTYAYGQSVMSPQQGAQQGMSYQSYPNASASSTSLPAQSMYHGLGYGQHPSTLSIQAPVSYAQSYNPQQQGTRALTPGQQPASGDNHRAPMASMCGAYPGSYYACSADQPDAQQQLAFQAAVPQSSNLPAAQAYANSSWDYQSTQMMQYPSAVGSASGMAAVEAAGVVPLQPVAAAPGTAGEVHAPQPLQPGTYVMDSTVPLVPEAAKKDLLSATLDSTQDVKAQAAVLQPQDSSDVHQQVLSSENWKDRSSKVEEKSVDARMFGKDPLSDPAALEKFITEVERFEKYVEGLTKKSLNGPTLLEQKWKEYLDAQDRESRKLSISVARCYPMKNRIPDVMPYDHNRVAMISQRDDYINASFVKDLTPFCPSYILTQAPLPATFSDFWAMVWEQQAETVVCLQNNLELKSHIYWPVEKGQQIKHGALTLCLQSVKEKQFYIERMMNITNSDNPKVSRVVIHLQLLDWPLSGSPASPAQMLNFISEVHSFHKTQRNRSRPIVVHCLGGVGRSGVFCLVSAAMKEIAAGNGLLDILSTAIKLAQSRKLCIQEKEQFKFCHDVVLYHAQDLLIKRGILTSTPSFGGKAHTGTPSHVRHPSEDFMLRSGATSQRTSIVPDTPAATATTSTSADDTSEQATSTQPEAAVQPVTVETETELSTPRAPEAGREISSDHSFMPEIIDEQGSTAAASALVIPAVESKDSGLTTVVDLLDPATFTLDPGHGTPAKQKITRESFMNPQGTLAQSKPDPKDPLSQLDPLWSLKKGKE
ncbi:tyrosine-protein phosphatase non-receptor type 23-like isoform X1 [Dermacentor andersoni]|uniref:tyrosine-protein phosphatase non-receptor type 23-like isoform X1 n=1 Tax=Dermacentor andersoni TaxID=34620 RepID=UPI00215500E5|nr:tyrosine-protein phosphatase non-receptor type 23-like isoform X1 [Dermacentor andersoni]